MNRRHSLIIALLLAPLAVLHPAGALSKSQAATPPEFVPITDDPKLPHVSLIGDSASIVHATAQVKDEVQEAEKGKGGK